MPFLVDSDLVIDYLDGIPAVVQLLETLAEEGIAISILTYMEVYEGLVRDPGQREPRLRAFLETVPLLEFSPAVARRCALLRHTLRTQNRQVDRRAIDLMIAATALVLNAQVVTRNATDYRDIPGLTLYSPPQG